MIYDQRYRSRYMIKDMDINIDTDKNFNPVTISFEDVETINRALEDKY